MQSLLKKQIAKRLVLGSANFGMRYGATNKSGELPLDEVQKILAICFSHGIKAIDTAAAYGKAEKKLGQVGVGEFKVTTKINPGHEVGTELILGPAKKSLENLKINRVTNLLLHDERHLNGCEAKNIAKSLHKAVSLGLAENVGVSSYDPFHALKLCKKYGFQIVQLPANALDSRLFNERLWESFLKKNIKVQIRSIFLQGLLLGETNQKGLIPKKTRKLTREFKKICKLEKKHPICAALGYVLTPLETSQIVFGVSKAEEVLELIQHSDSASRLKAFQIPKWDNKFNPKNWSP